MSVTVSPSHRAMQRTPSSLGCPNHLHVSSCFLGSKVCASIGSMRGIRASSGVRLYLRSSLCFHIAWASIHACASGEVSLDLPTFFASALFLETCSWPSTRPCSVQMLAPSVQTRHTRSSPFLPLWYRSRRRALLLGVAASAIRQPPPA